MIPENISQAHVLQAIEEVDRTGIPKRRHSKNYSLLYQDHCYPPKLIISLANRFANGEELSPQRFNGGHETNDFLAKLGFEIILYATGSR